MLKLIYFILVSTMLLAESIETYEYRINPLEKKMRSVDNGGPLHVIDAYEDGVGVMIQSEPSVRKDYSAYNNLVFKFGREAKENKMSLLDTVANSNKTSFLEKQYALKSTGEAFCDDKNPNTEETLVDGVCIYKTKICNDGDLNTKDTLVNGSCIYTQIVCDDGDSLTEDILRDGVCFHLEPTCNDNNPDTEDFYLDKKCHNILINCDDNNPNTIDTLKNGKCFFQKNDCDDNDETTKDILIEGICYNEKINCDDNNPNTIDKIINGKCFNTLISCDDNDPKTADKLIDGVCVHKESTKKIKFIYGTRMYNDNLLATSCNEYKNTPKKGYSYDGDIGSGIYRISPNGTNIIDVYCDMTNSGGGWTKIVQQLEESPVHWIGGGYLS